MGTREGSRVILREPRTRLKLAHLKEVFSYLIGEAEYLRLLELFPVKESTRATGCQERRQGK